jgi:SAM-dependent methyltransferase
MLVCPRCRGKLLFDDGCRCPACKVVFPVHEGVPRMNDGAPERDEKLAAEWKAQSNARSMYVDRTSIMNRWEEMMMPRLVDWLGDVRGPVLDVGCGIGQLGRVLMAAGRRDIELFGIDFHCELLAEAGTGYVALVEGDVHCLPIHDGEFAAVIASNALHHFAEPNVAMREITRVLRPGGIFVGHDPRYVTPLERAKKVIRRHDHAFTEDHRAFRVDEYRALLGAGGLTVSEVSTVDPAAPLVATALDYLKVGHLGVTEPVAKLLAAVDRRLAGPEQRTPFGLMLAGRAVKEGNA